MKCRHAAATVAVCVHQERTVGDPLLETRVSRTSLNGATRRDETVPRFAASQFPFCRFLIADQSETNLTPDLIFTLAPVFNYSALV